MQLVAYGAQDIYLTGNPQITFFKVVYRRHTNFAIESIEQTFNGYADFGKRVSCLISRNGDLINRIYLQATLPELDIPDVSFRWTDDIGHHLMRYMEVEIGGQRIDKQWSDWLQIWNDLSQDPGKQAGYKKMIGTIPALCIYDSTPKPVTTLYVPLQFWFCRNVGLSLPLIALQYHEVKINVDFRCLSELIIVEGNQIPVLSLMAGALWVDYIYLDTDERRRFAQVSHEYLIEQVQFTGDEQIINQQNKIRLSFNHPVKELVWVLRHNDFIENDENQWSNYTTEIAARTEFFVWPGIQHGGFTAPAGSANPVNFAKLQLNGHDRFATRAGDYFNLVQPFQSHTNIPTSPGTNVYSFALKAEEHQPSGTCNFSRIDNATLQLNVSYPLGRDINAQCKIFCVNYNVLRIMSGMGGLAYSN
ncbi:MAG: major capsid protein [Sulfobacillus sp.]